MYKNYFTAIILTIIFVFVIRFIFQVTVCQAGGVDPICYNCGQTGGIPNCYRCDGEYSGSRHCSVPNCTTCTVSGPGCNAGAPQ